MELSRDDEIELARKFFDHVYATTESIDDVVYEVLDPECKYGEKLCDRLNLDLVREVIALGFKAKYGVDWWQKAKPKTQGEWCANCETPGCDERRHGRSGKALLFGAITAAFGGAASDMLPPGLENEL